MKKKVIIVLIIAILVASITGLIVLVSKDNNVVDKPAANIPNIENEKVENIAPSKLDESEKEVSERKRQELFNFIPKVYTEGIAPFESSFILDAVMRKIININEDHDFSTNNVDGNVTKIFGKDAKINKEEVAEPDVAKSLFYYSKEAGSYAVIPVGYEGKFEYQIFKNATETDDAYYVYAYTLIGGYSYDEDSITQDEFGDVDYSNAKVQVIVGDKDGNDLVHVFDNYTLMYDETIWLNKYSNLMPIFRYTLKKDNENRGDYYLTEVEQINY